MHDPTFSAAEQAARKTASMAILKDYRDRATAWLDHGGEEPDWHGWALRLAFELASVLDVPAGPANRHHGADLSASYARPDGTGAELTGPDLMLVLSALDDACAYRDDIGMPWRIPAYRAVSVRLGDDR